MLVPVGGVHAQGAAFTGVVLLDETRTPIEGVDVLIPDASLKAKTNARGQFVILNVPSGRHTVVLRRIGYLNFEERMDFPADEAVERQFGMIRAGATLDTMRVVGKHPDMPGFDDHRRLGLGQFVGREELESQGSARLAEVLRPLRGVKIEQDGMAAYLSNGLGVHSAKTNACYALVYMNRAIVFRGEPNEVLFDLASIKPDMIEGLEYYNSPAKIPMEYSHSNDDCGVLVIWTRRSK